jgi:predicted helicase
MRSCIEAYNETLSRYARTKEPRAGGSGLIDSDDKRIKWSRQTKVSLDKLEANEFDPACIRPALYRPFFSQWHYFQDFWNEERYQMPHLFPVSAKETKNVSIIVKSSGEWPFFVLASDRLNDYQPQGGSQCFPFYTFDEDGTNRQENITDWALEQYRNRYSSRSISKWDIFHSTYAILHHPQYCSRYAANLKRELPRIPFVPSIQTFVAAGKQLMQLHMCYEQQKEFPLDEIENAKAKWTLRVEKLILNKEKSELRYNDALTLRGIPPDTYKYRLGNRSALEWIVDQYRVSTDSRSGIVNDPNRPDDERYILRLIRQIITVSLKTVEIINSLPPLEFGN